MVLIGRHCLYLVTRQLRRPLNKSRCSKSSMDKLQCRLARSTSDSQSTDNLKTYCSVPFCSKYWRPRSLRPPNFSTHQNIIKNATMLILCQMCLHIVDIQKRTLCKISLILFDHEVQFWIKSTSDISDPATAHCCCSALLSPNSPVVLAMRHGS